MQAAERQGVLYGLAKRADLARRPEVAHDLPTYTKDELAVVAAALRTTARLDGMFEDIADDDVTAVLSDFALAVS